MATSQVWRQSQLPWQAERVLHRISTPFLYERSLCSFARNGCSTGVAKKQFRCASTKPTASAPQTKSPPPSAGAKVSPLRPVDNKPRRHRRVRDGELVPTPLSFPLGVADPPRPIVDKPRQSWRQRMNDYMSPEKHVERRNEIYLDLMERNYFRDIGNLGKVHQGKSILAPSTPLRKEYARYFPNLAGRTLASWKMHDLAEVLREKVSIVTLATSMWGDIQCNSFVGKENGELQQLLTEESAHLQKVEINMQSNILKRMIIYMCIRSIRKQRDKPQWRRYFIAPRDFSDEVQQAIGVWNAQVGYVYLVDKNCKIRWVGNGKARPDERLSLVRCARRLIDEVARPNVTRLDPSLPSSTGTDPPESVPSQVMGVA